MDNAAIVTFDPGADLGLGAAGQDCTVAIDQVVVADLASAALLAVQRSICFRFAVRGWPRI